MLSPSASPTDTVRVLVSVTDAACVPVSSITGVSVSPNGETYTLPGSNGVCSALTIPFKAVVSGTGNYSNAVTWTTTSGSIATTGVLTVSTAGSYTARATSTDPTRFGEGTVTVNSCSGGVNPSITVQPNPENLVLGSIGTITATPNDVTGTPTWTSTTGCASFGSPHSLSTTVQGARVCRDSLVITIGSVKGYTILNVTSGASTQCTNVGGSSLMVPDTLVANGDCGVNQPYWFIHNPEIATILGAPYVCMIGTTAWPCGPTATIKAVVPGSTSYCDQPAVQDPTNPTCNNLTVTAASGDLIPNDASGVELDLQKQLGIKWATGPKPAGKSFDRIIPMSEYLKMKKMQLK